MKKNFRKRIFAVLAAAAIVISAAGCKALQSGASEKDDSLDKVLKSGRLILGLDTQFPPMGFIDENKKIAGFDIDVAREACRRLGVTLVTQGINWNNKEEDLNSGVIDCIWNGMSVNEERAASMCLSDPYMKNELIIVVTGKSDAMGMSDLSGKTVGVQSGSTAQDVLISSDLNAEVNVREFDNNTMLMKSLENGEIDAALIDSVSAYYYIMLSENQFYILAESLGEEEYAVGFRKKDRALRDKIQEIISEMKADGTLGKISKKWFGSDITIVK